MARPWWLKQLRLCGGFLALAVGIVLSIPLVPGPGIPLILFGLLLLSDHFVWARKTLEWARRKWQTIAGKR
jgi:hypothetical protein